MKDKQLAETIQILEAYKSIEYAVFKHMDKIANAYMRLTNAKIMKLTYAEAQEALDEIRLGAKDLYKLLVDQLNSRQLLPADIQNVNARVLPGLDLHWLNMTQYAQIFCFAFVPGQIITDDQGVDHIVKEDFKIKNLTALAYICRDFVMEAEAACVDSYYKDIVGH